MNYIFLLFLSWKSYTFNLDGWFLYHKNSEMTHLKSNSIFFWAIKSNSIVTLLNDECHQLELLSFVVTFCCCYQSSTVLFFKKLITSSSFPCCLIFKEFKTVAFLSLGFQEEMLLISLSLHISRLLSLWQLQHGNHVFF